MASRSLPTLTRTLALPAVLCAALPGFAQTAAPASPAAPARTDTQLAPVVVTGRATPSASVAGWGDIPLALTPLQANVFSREQLKDNGVQRLSDLVGFDPALADAYRSEGYWDNLTIRGFVIDNRFNYRRDGLPINAETSIPLENKAQIEVLKGTSGMQSGTSAPGGLVNLVVKRPAPEPLRRASIEWQQAGTVTGAFDWNARFGDDESLGLRINAAAARLDPMLRDARGDRHLLAVAGEWRASAGTLVEVEFESSRRSQPSQPGFSLLGNEVPKPVDPRINLNNQPWSRPVVLEGNTGSLRLTQRLSNDWRASVHAARQQLRSDDRVAFPFGCTDPDGVTYWADRYCPDGTFDLYDFRSENERRRSDAIDAQVQGRLAWGAVKHDLAAGVLHSRVRNRFQRQAFNFAGTGNVDGSLETPAAPELTDENTHRDERSTELYLRDAVALTERWTAWLGMRHTKLRRESVRTDGSRPTDYAQSFTTPFAALSFLYAPGQLAYASWGRGVESDVAPNRSRYTNAGEALPAARSRQVEIGLKGSTDQLEWNLAAFDIVRPMFADLGACDDDGTCTRQLDGTQRHRGVEANGAYALGTWTLRAGVQWLHARRQGSEIASMNGLQPTNVPARTLKVQAVYRVAALPGLSVQATGIAESRRMVLPDNSQHIAGQGRFDLAARYETTLAGRRVTWRAGIDNVTDKRAWRESPYQFGHAYLYPMAGRTARLSAELDL